MHVMCHMRSPLCFRHKGPLCIQAHRSNHIQTQRCHMRRRIHACHVSYEVHSGTQAQAHSDTQVQAHINCTVVSNRFHPDAAVREPRTPGACRFPPPPLPSPRAHGHIICC